MSISIQPSVFQFLKDVKANNNRDWFAENKSRYTTAHNNFKQFANGLHDLMSMQDEIERMKLHRIYRDVRFSKDKTPYSARFSGSFVRATKWKRGGYYFHLEPGASFVGGGFWSPESADLKRIRVELANDPAPLREIIASPDFVNTFGELQGDKLKTAPQGYPKDHPNIDLLRYKQFLVMKTFTDKEVASADFAQQVAATFQHMRPFFDFMSDVLTTDENGVPIE
ncbi:MAG: DUF2461 domain-containing protein [Bacteroidota bacterium]